ncbi:MAG: hypothetical protein Q8L48_37130 [Archangium sp.]|nr:hypothetical protein [Archangium sp.]
MLLALTLSLINATPDYSVVVARRLGVDARRAAELSAVFAQALEKDTTHPLGQLLPVGEATEQLKQAGFPDTSVCNGSAACVSSLARVSGLKRIVALQLVKVGSDLAVDASVVEGEAGRILGSVTRTVKLKTADGELEPLARELLSKVAKATPELVAVKSDAPKNVDLTPPPPLPPPEVEVTPAPGLTTGRKVALGLGGGAVVALGVGIGLGASALSQSNALSAIDPQFEEKAAAARGTALAADLGYIAAGSLAVGALVAWLVSPPPAP